MNRLGMDYSSTPDGPGKMPELGRSPAATNADNFYSGAAQHLPRSAADVVGRPELTPQMPDTSQHTTRPVGGRGGEYNS